MTRDILKFTFDIFWNVTHLKGRNGAKNEGEGGDDDKSDGDDGDNLTKDFKSAKKYCSLAGQKNEFSCLKLRALGENVFAQSCRSLGGDKSIWIYLQKMCQFSYHSWIIVLKVFWFHNWHWLERSTGGWMPNLPGRHDSTSVETCWKVENSDATPYICHFNSWWYPL